MRSRWRPGRLSLFTRVVLANAAVLTVVTLLLLFSPIEINAPVTSTQAVILVVGFLVSLVVSVALLHRVVAPVRRLAETMRSVDPLEPGRRLSIPGTDAEVDALATAFNEMLDRLEHERRESARTALAAQEQERLRIARELHDEVGQVLTGVMLELDEEPQAREAVRAQPGGRAPHRPRAAAGDARPPRPAERDARRCASRPRRTPACGSCRRSTSRGSSPATRSSSRSTAWPRRA